MARFNFKATLRGIAELLSNNVNFKQPPTLYLQGTYNIAVAPGDTVYIALFSSGGGGGCSTYTPNYADLKGGDGGSCSVSYAPAVITAWGGIGGTGGAWGNGSSFSNGQPGIGGSVDLASNFGRFTILEYANGANAVTGDRWSAQPVALGKVSELGRSNNGGRGADGVGDERWSYGGSGGAGAYIKLAYTNKGVGVVNLTLTVGHTGWGNTNGGIPGGNAEPAFAIVNY